MVITIANFMFVINLQVITWVLVKITIAIVITINCNCNRNYNCNYNYENNGNYNSFYKTKYKLFKVPYCILWLKPNTINTSVRKNL